MQISDFDNGPELISQIELDWKHSLFDNIQPHPMMGTVDGILAQLQQPTQFGSVVFVNGIGQALTFPGDIPVICRQIKKIQFRLKEIL